MGIVIFGDLFSFPEGDAATNRVHTFAKGFIENKVNVDVVCFVNEYRNESEGVNNGIPFYYPFNQKKRSNYFIIRRLHKLQKYYSAYNLIRKINKREKIAAINVQTNEHLTHLFSWFLAKSCNAKLVIECCENPLRHYQEGLLHRRWGILKFHIEARLCDGVLCISNFLINFHTSRGINARKLILVPSTVDPERFLNIGDKPFDFRYIGYFGALTFLRDNLDLLIKSFADITNLHPEFRLVLGGFCTEKEKSEIEELILQLNIEQKVVMLDYMKREEVIRYISHADILVMVRSKDLDSQASFPSKLTEFIATSKPVITVNVGEIADYFTDGVNAFVVEPEHSDMITEKLNYVINHYDSALQVGKKGREMTDTIFNYNYQAKRIIGFIESLNNDEN